MLSTHLTGSVPGGHGADTLVFLTPEGRAIRQGVFMRRVFEPARKKLPADKRSCRFHDLRHTSASLMIAAGTRALYVTKRLGHASIYTTMNLYGHAFPSMEASTAEVLDAMYEGPVEGPQPEPTPLRPATTG